MRANSGSAALIGAQEYLLFLRHDFLIEAQAADEALARELPGIVGALNALRLGSAGGQADPASFPSPRQPLEKVCPIAAAARLRDCARRRAATRDAARVGARRSPAGGSDRLPRPG